MLLAKLEKYRPESTLDTALAIAAGVGALLSAVALWMPRSAGNDLASVIGIVDRGTARVFRRHSLRWENLVPGGEIRLGDVVRPRQALVVDLSNRRRVKLPEAGDITIVALTETEVLVDSTEIETSPGVRRVRLADDKRLSLSPRWKGLVEAGVAP